MTTGERSRARALTALLALLFFAPHLRAQGATLLTNARVLLLDPRGRMASSVLLSGGRIVAFDDAAIARRGNAEVVDVGGATVMPAFTDHHLHLLNVGLWLLNDAEHERLFVDLSRVTSLEQLLRRVRMRAASAPAGAWVLGAGWSQAVWGDQALPEARWLTRAVPDHPVFLARTDGHAGWTNAAGLERAKIAGNPGGILLESANEPLLASLPPLADADVRRAWRLGAEALAARGVAEVYDAGSLGFPGVVALNADHARFVRMLREEDARSPLPLRVNLMIPAPSALADSLLAGPHRWDVSPRVRITHLKVFADGALGSRGAALTHPYADDSTTRGVSRLATLEITALALRAIDAGLGVATHAIGDEAVRRTLDAYEAVLAARPRLVPTRLRIEHFSYAREEDFERAARLGILLSIQSDFNAAPSEATPLGSWRVGAGNEPRVYAWDRLKRLGAELAEGSDYFARPLEPLSGYQAALTRRHAVGSTRPDSVARPLALLMQVARRVPDGRHDDVQLRLGGPADLVVLSDDPMRVGAAQLTNVKVLRTYNAGRLVYANGTDLEAPRRIEVAVATAERDAASARDPRDRRELPGLLRVPPMVAAGTFRPPMPLPPGARSGSTPSTAPPCAFADVGAPPSWESRPLRVNRFRLRLPRAAPITADRFDQDAFDVVASAVPDIGVVVLRVDRGRAPADAILDWRPVLWRTRCSVPAGQSTMTWTVMDVEDAPEYGRFVAEGRYQSPDGSDIVIGLAVRDPRLRETMMATFSRDLALVGR